MDSFRFTSIKQMTRSFSLQLNDVKLSNPHKNTPDNVLSHVTPLESYEEPEECLYLLIMKLSRGNCLQAMYRGYIVSVVCISSLYFSVDPSQYSATGKRKWDHLPAEASQPQDVTPLYSKSVVQ